MYSENKKKFLIFFFKPLSLLAHESFQSKSPEVWLATPDFSSVRHLAFGPPNLFSGSSSLLFLPQLPQPV
jgi:hypothetical protein